jgi:hypothetical protein
MLFFHLSLGNQRDVIKEKGWLAGNDSTYYYTKSRRSKFIDYQWKHAIVHSPLLIVGRGKNGGVYRRKLAGSMVFTVSLF